MNAPVDTLLDASERQTLFDLLGDAIVKHGPEARLASLDGSIDKARLAWHAGHRLHLIAIRDKLWGITVNSGRR